MKESSYTPVSCELYDELELLAMRKTHASISYVDEQQQIQTLEGVIADVYCGPKHIEYLKMAEGLELRLDRLRELNGKPFNFDPPKTRKGPQKSSC